MSPRTPRDSSPPPVGFLAKAKKIISLLKNDDKYADFRDPVPWEEWGLSDYPKLVQRPMDLSTISANLNALMYENAVSFRRDVELLWKNAISYNAPGSDIYKYALDVRDSFFRKCQTFKLSVSNSEDEGWMKACLNVTDALISHNESIYFREPLDWKEQGLHDYPKKIKYPMDLGTVKNKLLAKLYSSAFYWAMDVDLIWKNAMKYNDASLHVYYCASEMSKRTQKNIEEFKIGWPEWKVKLKKILERLLVEKTCKTFSAIESREWTHPDKEPASMVIPNTLQTPSLCSIYNQLMRNKIHEADIVVQTVSRVFTNAMSYWKVREGYTTPHDDAKRCLGIFKRMLSKEQIPHRLKKEKTPIVHEPYQSQTPSESPAVHVPMKRKREISAINMPPRKIQALPLGNTKSRMTDLTTELIWAVEHMMKHKDGHPFLKPVSESIAPGYFAVIDEPMDLATIKRKINSYDTIDAFDDDVQLMFRNALTYNTHGFMVKITNRLKGFYESEILAELRKRESHRKRLSPNLGSKPFIDFAPQMDDGVDPTLMTEEYTPEKFPEDYPEPEIFPSDPALQPISGTLAPPGTLEPFLNPEPGTLMTSIDSNPLEKLNKAPLKQNQNDEYCDYQFDKTMDEFLERSDESLFGFSQDFSGPARNLFGIDQAQKEFHFDPNPESFALHGAML